MERVLWQLELADIEHRLGQISVDPGARAFGGAPTAFSRGTGARDSGRRDAVRLHLPAPPRYRHQWYWDSCFHAIAWRHFDRAARARGAAHAAAGRPRRRASSRTPRSGRPPRWRRAPLYATASSAATRGTAIDPDAAPRARVGAVADSADDPAFATEALGAAAPHSTGSTSTATPTATA